MVVYFYLIDGQLFFLDALGYIYLQARKHEAQVVRGVGFKILFLGIFQLRSKQAWR
jgi:hypothetical protein